MSRDLHVDVTAELDAPTLRPFLCVALEFDSGTTRANSTPVDIVIDGDTFSGVGKLGRIGAIDESDEIKAAQVTLGLSGIPPDLVALALDEPCQGRRATLWFGLLDADHQLIGEPEIEFRGRMDTMAVRLADTATIDVRVEARLADWERARGGRYTHEDQLARAQGDLFFEFVPSLIDKEIVWGNSGVGAAAPATAAGAGGKK